MSEPVGREWRFYVDDMIGFAERVVAYAAGLDQAQFVGSALHYDATLRNLELIGEAATHIPETIRADTLWSIVVSDVPALLIALREVRGSIT